MKHPLPILTLFCVLCSAASAGKSEAEKILEYLPLNPDLVVDLQNSYRSFLRTQIELPITGKERVENIRVHIRAIRHSLIMLISEYSSDQLGTAEQREAFRQQALSEARATLDK